MYSNTGITIPVFGFRYLNTGIPIPESQYTNLDSGIQIRVTEYRNHDSGIRVRLRKLNRSPFPVLEIVTNKGLAPNENPTAAS